MVGELLDRGPDLRMLETSRSRLRLDGERVAVLSDNVATAMFSIGHRGVRDPSAHPSTSRRNNSTIRTMSRQAADAYSFAVMTYDLIVNRPPFRATSVEGLIYAHLAVPSGDPRAFGVQLDEATACALLAGLSKMPGERPSPTELIANVVADSHIDPPSAPPLVGARVHALARARRVALTDGARIDDAQLIVAALRDFGAVHIQALTRLRAAADSVQPPTDADLSAEEMPVEARAAHGCGAWTRTELIFT